MPVGVDPRTTCTLCTAFVAAMIGCTVLACASLGEGPKATFGTDEEPRPPSVRAVRLMEPVGVSFPDAPDTAEGATHYLRSRFAQIQGLDDNDTFTLRNRTERGGRQHIRLDQMHNGLKVWACGVVVHAKDGEYLSVSGTVGQNLANLAPSDRELDQATALDLSKEHYASLVPSDAAIVYEREQAERVYYPTGETFSLAWHTQFLVNGQGNRPPGLWHYFVDVGSGEVLGTYNELQMVTYQASGPGGNDKVQRDWVADLDVHNEHPDFPKQYVLDSELFVTTDLAGAGHLGPSEVVVRPSLGLFNDPTINDAHGYAEQVLGMLSEWYGFDSIDDRGLKIESQVHYGTNFDGAFWHDGRITYGDGGETFYPLSGDINVVGHEMHHGFTEAHSGLIHTDEPGALGESFADVAGTIAEFYAEGDAADWEFGSDVMQEEGIALRYLCEPTRDGVSIDHYQDYVPGINSHYASGIGNRAFCRAAKRFSGGDPEGFATVEGVRRAGELWFTANAGYWVPSTGFAQACQGLVDAAQSLGYSEEEVGHLLASFGDVGVRCEMDKPTCEVSAIPSVEATNLYEIVAKSNGDTCSWSSGMTDMGDIPCSGSVTRILSPGPHTLTLTVSLNGTSTVCETKVDAPQVEQRTCDIVLSRLQGDSETLFPVTWSAPGGTKCWWSLDGQQQDEIHCSGSDSVLLPPGRHVLGLIARLPSGERLPCSSEQITVSPTCSVTANKNGTNHTVNWSSSGKDCTWELDGKDKGEIPCSGEETFDLGPGEHTLRLLASSGDPDNILAECEVRTAR